MLSHRAIAAAFFWLLAQPPVGAGGVLRTDEPLGGWTAKGHFDTREACEQELAKRRTSILAATDKAQDPSSKFVRAMIEATRCVDSTTISGPART